MRSKKNVFEDIDLKENKNLDCMSLSLLDFPGDTSGKEPICRCRRCKRRGCDPWIGKIPWKRAYQPTPVFLPGEPQGQRNQAECSPWVGQSWTWLKQLSTHASPFKKFQTVYINFSSCYVCVKWGGGKKKLNMYKEKVSSLAWLIWVYFSKTCWKATLFRISVMVRYTLLYSKWITNKGLLNSTWNSAPCYVPAWIGGRLGGEWTHVYLGLSLLLS